MPCAHAFPYPAGVAVAVAVAVTLHRPARAFPEQVERGGERAFPERVERGGERAFPERVNRDGERAFPEQVERRGERAIPKQRPPSDGRPSLERPSREHIQHSASASASASNIDTNSTASLRSYATEAIVTPRTYVSAGLEDAEIPLLGGDMTEGVVRIGRTVRAHTAAVHALLRHLDAAGFDGAPRVLGIDANNREVLTYLPGVVARRPRPAFATADATLAALARLQLRYHEAVAGFEPPPDAQWDGEVTRFVDGPVDIICHCDINLENVIFQLGPDGLRPYALIDFDLARPGPVWSTSSRRCGTGRRSPTLPTGIRPCGTSTWRPGSPFSARRMAFRTASAPGSSRSRAGG